MEELYLVATISGFKRIWAEGVLDAIQYCKNGDIDGRWVLLTKDYKYIHTGVN